MSEAFTMDTESVIKERARLEEHIIKLMHYLDSDQADKITPGELPLLVKQLSLMTDYRDILDKRIFHFSDIPKSVIK